MALGGGTYLVQNKVLPGTYINFVSQPRALGSLGERGVVCMGLAMDWGSSDVITIDVAEFQTGMKSTLGYDYADDAMQTLREVFCGAKQVKLFRLNDGAKATLTMEGMTFEAKYGGIRGNDLKIAIEENVDEEGYFTVKTYLDIDVVDEQIVSEFLDLADNDYITFKGDGTLELTAPTVLQGGTTNDISGSAYTTFLGKAEAEDFNVLIYDGEDAITKKLFVNFTKRMRDDEGVKFVLVLSDYTAADHEGVISVNCGTEFVYWCAGMTAGAEVNESLTNAVYDGEYTFALKKSKSEYVQGIQNGEFMFYMDGEDVRVLRDINTFTSYISTKNSDFSSNRVVRVLDSIGNDVARIFSDYYLGKQSNNANGRNLLKAEIISYHEQLQSIEAIEDFECDDITIEQGTEKQDVVVYEIVKPTDAMEKLYMKVEVI